MIALTNDMTTTDLFTQLRIEQINARLKELELHIVMFFPADWAHREYATLEGELEQIKGAQS